MFQVFRAEGAICPKCPHYKTCTQPCYPVYSYLEQCRPKHVYEKHGRMFSDKKEVKESDLKSTERGQPTDTHDLFSTEKESPFLSEGPSTVTKQTGLFIDRFFNKMTFKDLAVKYDCKNESHACILYQAAIDRIRQILDILEKEKGARYALEPTKEKLDKAKLPKSRRWYLLYALFNISPQIIARIEGNHTNACVIQQRILDVDKGLKDGTLQFFHAGKLIAANRSN